MHNCPVCRDECFCDGNTTPTEDNEGCTHPLRSDCNPIDEDKRPTVEGWLCSCGNFQLGPNHCESCGGDPPWAACNCDLCSAIMAEMESFGLGGEA